MSMRHGIKRKLIQLAAFGFSNIHAGNFYPKIQLYTGKWKYFCNPGLNCYSCPAATFSCPIGALQAVNGSMKFSLGFYALGIILAFGVLFGRAICGFICPFGLIQELIGKLPVKKHRLPKWTRYIKYGVLVWFVFLWPWILKSKSIMDVSDPTFCEYICPAGLLFAGVPLLLSSAELRMAVGPVFSVKLCILIIVVIGCVFVFRFFCKTLCPLGAIYGILNKISFYRLTIENGNCIECGKCAKVCRMDVDPVRNPNSAECIYCGDCVHACPANCIHIGFTRSKRNAENKGL